MASKQTIQEVPSIQPECNSLVIEDWFEELNWQGKLAACLLHRLLTADSERLSGIGRQVLERLHSDVIETEGLTEAQNMGVREIYLLMSE